MNDDLGILKFSDGCKYQGNYVNDKFEGQGVFTWPDGRKYDG